MNELCKNCGQPIQLDFYPYSWIHKDGKFGCKGSKPCDPVTYAEPKDSSA